jgi:hypothetical protein
MQIVSQRAFEDEKPTKPINDAPSLLRIRRVAEIARARIELDSDPVAAADALDLILRIAAEALS